MTDAADGLLTALADLVGRTHVIPPGPDQQAYVVDRRGRYRGHALAVVKPGSTAEVAAVVKCCAAHGVAVVPQGGNTGMCAAATPMQPGPAVVLRLDRLRRIIEVNPTANTITVEAGCILAEIQAAAAEMGRLFPLSLGAEGSCQIGGNIATNAGGTGVLRYGPTRDLFLGLEVVLPDRAVSFQPRLAASTSPRLMPCPPNGEWICAASPANSTRPRRHGRRRLSKLTAVTAGRSKQRRHNPFFSRLSTRGLSL